MFGIICGPSVSPALADSYRIEPKTGEGRRLKERRAAGPAAADPSPYRMDPETEARVIAECAEIMRQNEAARRGW